jgi:NAD(P)-dependent dehydrogenase (short-subunit alcohol dehydrogenase family)
LAAAGASVALWARDTDRNAEACRHLKEFAPGVQVVAYACDVSDEDQVEPGKENPRWVEATVKRTPLRRWGRPSDLRDIAAYLADPALVFHTGDSIVIDGGHSIF